MGDVIPALFMFEKDFCFFTFCHGPFSPSIYINGSLPFSKSPYNCYLVINELSLQMIISSGILVSYSYSRLKIAQLLMFPHEGSRILF